MTNARIIQYQALLLDHPCTHFQKQQILNTAPTLPGSAEGELLHDYLEVVEHVQSLQPDLTDVPWTDPYLTLLCDRSSFKDMERYAGAAVVTVERTVWAEPLWLPRRRLNW